jgi:hypothetical protein
MLFDLMRCNRISVARGMARDRLSHPRRRRSPVRNSIGREVSIGRRWSAAASHATGAEGVARRVTGATALHPSVWSIRAAGRTRGHPVLHGVQFICRQ